jgi:anti-sigma factor RsiW
MIGCSEQDISEYVDGELSAASAFELERHLWTCADCRALLREYQARVTVTRLLGQRLARERSPGVVKARLTQS